MSGRLRLAGVLAAALALAPAFAPQAEAQGSGVKVGSLTCNVASGWGFVFGSSRGLNCTFSGLGRSEYYLGSITRFGADIGYQSGGVLVWTVVAPTAQMMPGSLAGNYAGGTASATVGVGVGANAMIGGSNNNLALQPLSLEGNTGLNVAAGIVGMTLSPAR